MLVQLRFRVVKVSKIACTTSQNVCVANNIIAIWWQEVVTLVKDCKIECSTGVEVWLHF